jgi:hypothetical protein
MTKLEARGVFLRLVIALPLLIGLAWLHGTALAQGLLAPMRPVLELAVSPIGALRLAIDTQQTQPRLVAEVVTERVVAVKGRVLWAGVTLRAALPTYVVLVAPLVLMLAALTWQGLTWRGRLLRLCISFPLLLVLELIDAPAVLTIEIYDSIPGVGPDAAESLWGIWVRFLDGGGRYALALGAALLAADVQNRLRRGRHPAQHDLVAAIHAVTPAL